jgi:GNAT superfamily N-acetyltransferase
MISIRSATRADVELILEFIRGLAEYERAPESAVATTQDLVRDGFSENPKFRVEIAEWKGQAAGFAFFFYCYSTWLGRPGIYLEDLFVHPQFRGRGIGKALLVHLAQIAVRENCYGMRWQVLDWNTPSIEFYESLGAKQLKDWIPMRVMGEELEKLAAEGSLRQAGD